MQSRTIELFYLFFQGILCFQVILFLILYFITRRNYLLIYSLFLLSAAAYFFINAPATFFNIPEDEVWNSSWYNNFNTPVIIIMNFLYLLFLRFFYIDIAAEKKSLAVFRIALWSVPVLIIIFVVLASLKVNRQIIFYIVNLISIFPAVTVILHISKHQYPFSKLLVWGLICYITGTLLTLLMNILRNYGAEHLLTYGYPLLFIRLGILSDMIFLLVAMLQKWHWQEKQLVLEKIQSQLAVEQFRNKISAELHDDIGSTLSGIAMYSHLTKEQLKLDDKRGIENSLDIMEQSSVQMVNKLYDIVWLNNPQQDSLQKLTDKLEEYARQMASAKNMEVKIEVYERMAELSLPVEQRRNIYLFCKEAINNAVKYSNGTALELVIKETNGILEFSIGDNGKGFDTLTVKRGNGLDNMQRRADEMGAKLFLESKKDEGARLSLQMKIT